jgi:hypothetical protein
MGISEKIVPLIRKRLLAYGYDDEQIPTAVGEDLSHIYRLTIREANYRPEVGHMHTMTHQFTHLYLSARRFRRDHQQSRVYRPHLSEPHQDSHRTLQART